MADAFEHEIEELVARVAGELARDIASLILRRLGIANGEAHGWVAPKSGQRRRGRPAAAAAPKPSRAGKRGGKRSRASADEMAERVERVARIVEQSDGVSSSDIEKKAKLPRNVVQAAIRALREQGRIFMGGTKRFARYATTQKHADSASVAAHG